MISLFPNGVLHYIIGGLLIGLSVVILFYLKGVPVGASTSIIALISYFSRLKYFQDKKLLSMRNQRIVLAVGFIIGAFIFALITNEFFVTKVSYARLITGGFLIGLGARMSRGCTSGHGICGVGSRSKESLYAVIIFVLFGILTAQLILRTGWLG